MLKLISSRVVVGLCMAFFAVGSAGCSSASTSTSSSPSASDGGGATPSASGAATYKGTFAGAKEGGSLEVTVSSGGTSTSDLHPLAGGTQQVTGTLHVSGGATVTLSGTFDPATNQISFTGGGYTFSGTIASGGVNGSYQGPSGAGSFSLLTGATVTPYCGTFAGDATGVWNFVVSGSSLSGTAVDSKGNGDVLTGSIDGTGKVTMSTKNGSSADGQVNGTTATGNWQNAASSSKGTWTGTAGCQ